MSLGLGCPREAVGMFYSLTGGDDMYKSYVKVVYSYIDCTRANTKSVLLRSALGQRNFCFTRSVGAVVVEVYLHCHTSLHILLMCSADVCVILTCTASAVSSQ
jgi:hypothetical protein